MRMISETVAGLGARYRISRLFFVLLRGAKVKPCERLRMLDSVEGDFERYLWMISDFTMGESRISDYWRFLVQG